MSYDKTNEEALQDASGIEFKLGQLVCDADPRDATYYGRVVGFTSTDLGHYPTIVVDWENSGVEEHSGMRTYEDGATLVEDVFVCEPRASRR